MSPTWDAADTCTLLLQESARDLCPKSSACVHKDRFKGGVAKELAGRSEEGEHYLLKSATVILQQHRKMPAKSFWCVWRKCPHVNWIKNYFALKHFPGHSGPIQPLTCKIRPLQNISKRNFGGVSLFVSRCDKYATLHSDGTNSSCFLLSGYQGEEKAAWDVEGKELCGKK